MNLYDSIIEAVDKYKLPAQERGQLYTAAIEYLYWGREPDFKMSRAAGLCYEAMHPVFEKQRAKQTAGRSGGKAKAENLAKSKQTPSKPSSKTLANDVADAEQNATEQEQEQEYKETLPKGSAKKAPPSLPEIEAYIEEKGIGAYVTAEEFVGYYGSQGWVKANGKPLTNWKQAVSGWASREKRQQKQRQGGGVDYGDWDF